ncbi:MAG TPA: hypothetical protein V6C97_14300 [Oculatellaceae cyanobacterium]
MKLFQLGTGNLSHYDDNRGRYDLISAVAHLGQDALDILLAQGVAIDTLCDMGDSIAPLNITALTTQAGNINAAKALISHGAGVNHTYRDGYTPLQMLMRRRGMNVNAVRSLVLRGGWLPLSMSEHLKEEIDRKSHALDEQDALRLTVCKSPRGRGPEAER